jgi:hypothetical protein
MIYENLPTKSGKIVRSIGYVFGTVKVRASARALNENVIGMLKRFKIIADRYRNRRKRFALRFNLISAIYNFEING